MDLADPLASIIPSLEGRVLAVLAHTSAPLSGSQVAAVTTRGSNPGVRVALARLVRHGLALARHQGPSILYTANKEHLLWPAVEQLVLATDGTPQLLRDRIRATSRNVLGPDHPDLPGTTVAIFGSAARRSAGPDSDIDLVVVTPDELSPHLAEALFQALVSRIQRWTGNDASVVDVSAQRLAAMVASRDPLIASWLQEAETVYGPDLARRIREIPCPA